MLGLVGVTAGTAEGAFTGDFNRKGWLLAGKDAAPGVQHFGFLHARGLGGTASCPDNDSNESRGFSLTVRSGVLLSVADHQQPYGEREPSPNHGADRAMVGNLFARKRVQRQQRNNIGSEYQGEESVVDVVERVRQPGEQQD